MSKISELGPIKGANTRSEDLFVIVNLIQGDDGTKNITRKELSTSYYNMRSLTGSRSLAVRLATVTISIVLKLTTTSMTDNDLHHDGEINSYRY